MRRTIMMATGLLAALFAAPSWSALITESCANGSGDDLTPSVQCTYVYDDAKMNGAANDSDTALNNLNIFDENTWNLLGKQEEGGGTFSDSTDPGEPNLINLSVTNNATGDDANVGTWSFDSSAWSIYDPIALVMKDGNNAAPQTKGNGFYVYLLEATTSSGDWTTVDAFDGANLSHMSAYGVRNGVEIPAPGILGLMGIGILGLGAFARRRRSA